MHENVLLPLRTGSCCCVRTCRGDETDDLRDAVKDVSRSPTSDIFSRGAESFQQLVDTASVFRRLP